MTAHSERRRVPYSPEQMFDLVADVAAYQEFIPWIKSARIRKRTETGPGLEQFEADMVVSFTVFRESYTSLVKTSRGEGEEPARVDAQAINGPFNKLTTRYAFYPADNGACDMALEIDFAFRNRILQRAAGAAFDLALRKVAVAFEDRAKVLYGSAST